MLLSELPVEIILIIFKSVKNKADLASLAACSRLFWKVAMPLLFAEISLTGYLWEVEYDENDKRLDRPGDTTQVSWSYCMTSRYYTLFKYPLLTMREAPEFDAHNSPLPPI